MKLESADGLRMFWPITALIIFPSFGNFKNLKTSSITICDGGGGGVAGNVQFNFKWPKLFQAFLCPIRAI